MPSYECKTCQRVTIPAFPGLPPSQCPHCGAKSILIGSGWDPESARWWRLT